MLPSETVAGHVASGCRDTLRIGRSAAGETITRNQLIYGRRIRQLNFPRRLPRVLPGLRALACSECNPDKTQVKHLKLVLHQDWRDLGVAAERDSLSAQTEIQSKSEVLPSETIAAMDATRGHVGALSLRLHLTVELAPAPAPSLA